MSKHADYKHTIAILDDRPEQRQTLLLSIQAHLPTDWQCINAPLLPTASSYAAWIKDNLVRVLVADQVLNEHSTKPSEAIDYKGNEVTAAIREIMPNFPIFIVTAHPGDADLSGSGPAVEAILNRRDLTKDAATYVPRMLRAGMRHHEDQSIKLTRLSELAAKVASGQCTPKDAREMKQLQSELGAPSSMLVSGERAELLTKAEREIEALNSLRKKIEAFAGI